MANAVYTSDEQLEDQEDTSNPEHQAFWRCLQKPGALDTMSAVPANIEGILTADEDILTADMILLADDMILLAEKRNPILFEVKDIVLQVDKEEEELYQLYATLLIGGTNLSGYNIPALHLSAKVPTAISTPSPPAWEQRLRQLKQLPDGWDSYGALHIRDEAIKKARSILQSAADNVTSMEAFVAPCPNGGLQIEWDFTSGKELIIEIPPEGVPVSFLLSGTIPTSEQIDTEGLIVEKNDLDKLLWSIEG